MKFIDKEKIGLHRKPIHVFLLEDTHRVYGKKTKSIKRITQSEADSIYEAIERLSSEE